MITRIARSIRDLDENSQRLFIETLFDGFDERRRLQWFRWISHLVYPESRWQRVERWMEGQFRRDMGRTPVRVARVCMNYFRVDRRMYPYLVRMARRVKNRVYMRVVRSGGRDE